VLHGGHGTMGVGSGIVWDSDAEAEFDECALKAQFLKQAVSPGRTRDFALIETMRWEAGRIDLWDLHVERLRESATYFAFPFDADAMRRAVDQHMEQNQLAPHKVRLTLDRRGRVDVTSSPIDPPASGLMRLILSDVRIDSSNPFRHHKTTRRDVYQRAYQQAQQAGADEALLINERGEVTEGARTNVFIEKGGYLLTPPLASGVLNGVYRRHLLRTRDVREQVLYPADVHAADQIILCNAVRGEQEATLVRDLAGLSMQHDTPGRE